MADVPQKPLRGHSLPKGVVIQIDHADNYLREEIIITKNDSLEERVVFTCDTTGNEGGTTLNGKAIRGKSHWSAAS